MRLTGWFIDGFGVFRQYQVRGLDSGLTVFHGPNEAGKSTLLAFVRGMLFGFGDGRSREPRYPPLRGGRNYGRLFAIGPQGEGEYIIERQAGRRPPFWITLPDGRGGDENDMRRLIGGADDRLFRSIFAFSLTELQAFESLTEEGIRDRIFSAGIAGAGRSARAATRELDRRASALLKSRGQAAINDLIADLNALRGRTEEARRVTLHHVELLEEEERRSAEIARLGSEADALRRQKTRLLTLSEMWPVWTDLQTATSELADLPPIDDFVKDPESRLLSCQHEVRLAEQASEELLRAQRQAILRRDELTVEPALAAVSGDAEHLYEALSLHRSLLQQVPALSSRITEAKQRVKEMLRVLGTDWTESRVEGFDRSLSRQDEVRRWDERLTRLSSDVERLRREIQSATSRRAELEESRNRLAKAVPADLNSDAVLEQHDRAFRRLRANLSELRVAEAESSARTSAEHDRERALRALEASAASYGWIWGAGVACLIAGAGFFIWPRDGAMPWWAPQAGAAIVAVALLIIAWQWRKSLQVQQARREEVELLRSDLASARAEGEAQKQLASELLSKVGEDAEFLNLPRRPSPQAIEERDAEFGKWKAHRARLADAQRECDSAVNEVGRLTLQLQGVERSADEERTRWKDWKAAAGLPATLSPSGVLEYLESLRQCQESIRALRTTREEADAVADQIHGWEERARQAVTRGGATGTLADERLIEELLALRRRCQRDRETRTALAMLEKEIEEREVRLGAGRSALQTSLETRAALFAAVGATDEAGFQSRLGFYRRRQALHERIQNLERQIVSRIGRGADADTLRSELAAGRIEEWRREADAAEARADEIQENRDEAVARHRDTERARTALEASGDLARLDIDVKAIEAELASAAREWRVINLARTLIDETLREFERTRQPAVLAEASRTFSEVTGGRYVRVVQEENGQDLAVIDANGGRRPAEALSRGTAEQLYLCIRLALAAEFARRSEPLPLVMDDVLVNFDPGRALSMARVVAEFARQHQVLLFTCHPGTRDMLVGVAPQTRVYELESIELSPAEEASETPAPDGEPVSEVEG